MTSQYTPDEAMDYRRQLDTAGEELPEEGTQYLDPLPSGEVVAPASPEDPATATVAAPETQGWWARLTRGLRRHS
jgi:hypothetical protein